MRNDTETLQTGSRDHIKPTDHKDDTKSNKITDKENTDSCEALKK